MLPGQERIYNGKKKIREYTVLSIGSVIAASGMYFFMIPGNIVMGSVTGFALILVNFIPVSVSAMTLLLNILCLLLGFLLVGKEFGAKTVYVSVLIPTVMGICEGIFPDIESFTGNVALDIICTVIIVSMGQAMMFQAGASSGGLDIIAKIMNKYLHIGLGQAIMISGCLVILSSVLVYDINTLIVGALATYFDGLVVNEYIGGFTRKKKICIISEQYQEIKQYIVREMRCGVTMYLAKGGYSDKEHVELITILHKNECGKLMNYMQKRDLRAFITVYTVSEVVSMWNRAG